MSPSNFGEFSFGFALILIISRFNDFGINSSLLKYVGETKDIKLQQKYFNSSLLLKLKISLLIITIGFFVSHLFKNQFNLQNPSIVLISFILALSSVYFEHLLASLQSLRKFGLAVIAGFLQSSIKLILSLVFFLLSFKDTLSIFIFYSLAPIIPVLFSKKIFNQSFFSFQSIRDKSITNKIFSMSKHTAIANISITLSSQLSILMTQIFLSSYETGILGAVSKIQLLFSLVSVSLGNVLFPKASRYKNKSDRNSFIKKSILLVLFLAIIYISVYPFISFLISFTIGNQYFEGLKALRLLIAASFITIANTPFIALFYSINKNVFFSSYGTLQILLIFVTNLFFIPRMGLVGTGYAQIITNFTILIFTIIWLRTEISKKD
jgi:O-antigen/teichoic acid export membrane protein